MEPIELGLIQQIEDAFAISLGGEEAEQARTVGDLHRLVLAKLGEKPVRRAATAEYVTRRALAEALDLPRASVRPAKRLEELLPAQSRAETWERIRRRTDVRFPDLRYTRQWNDGIMLASMAIAALPVVAVWWVMWALDWIRGLGSLLFAMPAALGFLLLESRVDKHLMEMLRKHATEVPAETVGELAAMVLELNPTILQCAQAKAAALPSLTVWDTIAGHVRDRCGLEMERIHSQTAIPELPLLKAN